MTDRPSGRYVHRRVNSGCCGPFALHVCTGLSLELVLEAMRPLLGKRTDWKGSASPRDLHATLERLGVPYTPFNSIVGETVIEAAWPGRFDPALPIILHVPQHYVTLYQGRVIDQVEARGAYRHWQRYKYIKEAWLIQSPPIHTEEELLI